MHNTYPEARVDKNGHLVTRHVKKDTNMPQSAPVLPSPRLDAPTPDPAPAEPVDFFALIVNEDLESVLGKSYHYSVDATDDQIYDVFSIVDRDEAIALLNKGIHSRDDALELLLDNDLGHLRKDRRELVADLKGRGISAISTLRYYNAANDESNSRFIADGIETMELVQDDARPLPEKYFNTVCDGRIRLSDIKEVGAKNIALSYDEEDWRDPIYGILQRISAEESNISAQQLKQVIESVLEKDKLLPVSRNAISGLATVGMKVGGEAITNLKTPVETGMFFSGAMRYSEDVSAEAVRWIDEYYVAVEGINKADVDEILELGNSGAVTPEKAVDGLRRGMSARQMIAVSEGVQPSVSDGWL